MKIHLIILLSILQFATAQLNPTIESTNPHGSLALGNNLFNSEKFKTQQGFSVGTSFSGNQSMSYGMFSNNFQYDFKSNLQMTGGVHFLQKTANNPLPYQNNNFDLLYDLNLKYQPWENTWIQLSVSNMSPYRYRNKLFNQ